MLRTPLSRTAIPAALLAGVLFWSVSAPPSAAHEGLHEQIEALDAALARNPEQAGLWLRRGELHRLHRDWRAAGQDYDRAAALDPALPGLLPARAGWLLDTGRPAEARALLDARLADGPDPTALDLRAQARLALGDTLGACRDLASECAATEAPKPDLFVRRAQLFNRLGVNYLDSALQALDEGIGRLGPLVALELEAVPLEARRGAWEAALARIDRLAGSGLPAEQLLTLRASVLERAGRALEAQAAWTEALDLLEASPHASTASRRALADSVRAALDRSGRLNSTEEPSP